MSRLRTVYKEFLIAVIPVIVIAIIARVATGTFSLTEIFTGKSTFSGLVLERSLDFETAVGEKHNLWVKFENTGEQTWRQDGREAVFLLSDKVINDPFKAENSTWVTGNKIGLWENEVAPGDIGSFRFTVDTADITPGTYTRKFKLVDSNLQELKGVKSIIWTITLADPVWRFELVGQSADLIIAPEQVATLTASFRNTGNTTWHNYGTKPVRLVVAGERESEFYIDPRWPDQYHPGFLDESSVRPGEIGTFTWEIQAPEALGVIRAVFRPEVFGEDDLARPEVVFDIAVAPAGEATKKEREPLADLVADDDSLRLISVPVGHGDSYIMITPSEDIVVFDTGHPSRANIVVSALRRLGVDKIDHLILSHSHWDHIGGAPYIFDVFPVTSIYVNGEGYPYATYSLLADYFTNNGSNVKAVAAGDRIDVGSEVSIDIYNPPTKLSGINDNDEIVNNNAIVARVLWQDRHILLCSDIYTDTIVRLLESGFDLSADIMTLPHHGNDGWGEAENNFLETVAPELVIKSSDWDELQTETSPELLNFLKNKKSLFLPTASLGQIYIDLSADNIWLEADNLVWRN
jgi:competence protein ComEC